ncbi:MAG TPA: L,D-transpeptidase family protein [Candidatus Omnitrophota bacterium]|nr:L,D-transpeptidase family protein [Candidatus Omnitrophota bacterium]HQB12543.1 L,D-transpeptidase family protein [Candidatus Omnitrophota bacterium]
MKSQMIITLIVSGFFLTGGPAFAEDVSPEFLVEQPTEFETDSSENSEVPDQESASQALENLQEETVEVVSLSQEEKPVELLTDLAQIALRTSPAQMKQNLDKIFVSKTAAGIFSYTIQSGDSLYVLARKNNTTVDLIRKLNHLEKDVIYPGDEIKIFSGDFSILVDKSSNRLTLFADGQAVKEYKVSTGKNNSTPVGEFKITDKLVNPTWFKSGAIYAPGSPDNELGTRWLGFDKPGYGIHGTIEPEKIGTQASEGCIRMLNQDVEEIDSLVPSGARVVIQD